MKLIDTIKINNVINWKYGFFQYAFDNDLLPLVDWYLTEDATRNTLDFELYLKHKDKDLSGYAIFLFEEVGGGKIGTQQFNPLEVVETIVHKYKTKWDKLFDAFSETYNPIHNYDMVEEIGKISKETMNKQSTTTYENTNTATDIGEVSVDTNITNTQTNQNNVFGFNSVDSVGASDGENVTTSVGTGDTNKEKTDMTRTNTGSAINDYNASDVVDNNETRNLTRKGNIGVTSTQDLLQKEVDVRSKNILAQIMIRDVVKELTLAIYLD